MSSDRLAALMVDNGLRGHWVKCLDREPAKYGEYLVIHRTRGRSYTYDTYLYNGANWVTRGNSLSWAVEAWFEKEEEADEKAEPAAD